MRHRAGLFGFLAIALFSTGAWAQAPEPCRLQRLAALDITYDPAGRPVIPASIGGKPVNLLVDTAGLFTSLEEKKARSMGLHLETLPQQMLFMFDGTPINYKAAANDLLIGHAPLKQFTFMIHPNGRLPDGVDGTLGPDIMSNLDVDFDFAANKLNLFAPSKCAEHVVYWADDYSRLPIRFDDSATNRGGSKIDLHNIRTTGTLDGKDVKITVDTGSTLSVMTMAQAQLLFHWSGDPPDLQKVETSGDGAYYTYPFKTLTMNGITVNNPKVMIVRQKGNALDSESDMILGMSVLRQLHVYIAYNQRLIYATTIPAATKAN